MSADSIGFEKKKPCPYPHFEILDMGQLMVQFQSLGDDREVQALCER